MSSFSATSFNQAVIEEFRANAGRVGGPFEGSELILLTTTGARSGKPHTVPLGFVREDDELFARVVGEAPGYGEYQERTRRVIPVVALQRTHEAPAGEGGIAGKLLEVHGWLRAQLALVREQARAGGPGSLGLQLRQHCLAFCHTLEFHHRSEDAGLFPYLEQQHPHMREFFRMVDAEHRVIARLQEELVRALDGPGAGFSERVERLSRELEAHLDSEEAQLLPVLRALGA